MAVEIDFLRTPSRRVQGTQSALYVTGLVLSLVLLVVISILICV